MNFGEDVTVHVCTHMVHIYIHTCMSCVCVYIYSSAGGDDEITPAKTRRCPPVVPITFACTVQRGIILQ